LGCFRPVEPILVNELYQVVELAQAQGLLAVYY
jgi:hypothetical protein